jgi:hypothetical protein
VIVIEVMARDVDREWWADHRVEVAAWFRQESLVIRATTYELL